MFSSSKKSPMPINGKFTPSILSADMTVTGNLVTEGEIQLNGTVQGDVKAGVLIVGEKASVVGDIRATTVLVKGEVRGAIFAQSVELARTARVHGDVWHETLSIEAGAQLEGMCRRGEPNATPKLELMPPARTAEV